MWAAKSATDRERCVLRPSRANIVNPARLDFAQANNVCIQCHSQGQPLKTPSKANITIGPLVLRWQESSGILESGRSQARRTVNYSFRGRHGSQESDAEKRFCYQSDVHPWRELL